ncbi:MAG: hypothetical protein FD181_3621 [Prolixibacteraceae bacterium]|nr:MAG: hypothetical protein FD181_3621 [Prolixibacteraceae bacterium]
MKKSSLKKHHSDFDDSFGAAKKIAIGKDKSPKKRLSIYDEYEEEEDLFPQQEKFKSRRK